MSHDALLLEANIRVHLLFSKCSSQNWYGSSWATVVSKHLLSVLRPHKLQSQGGIVHCVNNLPCSLVLPLGDEEQNFMFQRCYGHDRWRGVCFTVRCEPFAIILSKILVCHFSFRLALSFHSAYYAIYPTIMSIIAILILIITIICLNTIY